MSLLCPGGGSKRLEPGVARGIQFLLSASPSPSLFPCVSCTRVNRQPNLDVSSRPRLACWLFTGPRALPPFISHYEDPGLGLGILCVEGTGPTAPLCASLAAAPAPSAMVQVRSKVTGSGEGRFTFRFDGWTKLFVLI